MQSAPDEGGALPVVGGYAAPAAEEAAPDPSSSPPAASPPEPSPESAPDPAANAAASSEAAPTQAAEGDAGLLGRLRDKVAPTVQRVAEMESVQKGYERIKEVSHRVAENEKVQQGVEKVQKGLEVAKDTGKVVMEKTQQGIEAVKEKTREWRAGAGTVWEKGRGSIQRIRTEGVSALAWRGSAKDTLAMEEQWKDIKVQGAEELSVPARTEHTCAYHVSKGSTLRWTFRVKDHDIGFAVRMRIQVWGGSQEEEVLAMERYDNNDTISGSWVADEDRTLVLAFDNRYSKLRSKTVAYIVGTEKPPVFVEEPRQEAPADPRPVV